MKILNNYIKENYDKELKTILQEAQDMLDGIYIYNGNWDMEPCLVPINNKAKKWNVRYNDDPEWAFMFCRFDYLYKFVIAYEISTDEKYIQFAYQLIRKWQKDNLKYLSKWVGRIIDIIDRHRNFAHRTLDVGIQMQNVCDFVSYCSVNHLLNDKILSKIKKKYFKMHRIYLL